MGSILSPRTAHGGEVQIADDRWTLSIPSGPAGAYRWAQLDDYLSLPRSRFAWRPPLRLEITARASEPAPQGTWGFGLWNDPFSMSFGLGGAARRVPALPNCAWFFYASPPNHLSLRDDLPAEGFFAGVFRSPRLPTPLLLAGSPAAALLAWPWAARRLRRLGRRVVRQASAAIPADPTAAHRYALEWWEDSVRFTVDDAPALETALSPLGPLGLVLWVDNQYAAFPPSGRVRFGTLPNPAPVTLWLEDFSITQLST